MHELLSYNFVNWFSKFIYFNFMKIQSDREGNTFIIDNQLSRCDISFGNVIKGLKQYSVSVKAVKIKIISPVRQCSAMLLSVLFTVQQAIRKPIL